MNTSLKDARILIIDDLPLNIEILENLMSIEGYTHYKSISDSTKAIETIDSFKPALILLDLMMPTVSGYDILTHLKENNKLSGKLKVLVLTADATTEAKEKCLDIGANDFLTKPFDMVETTLRIKNLLYSVYLHSQVEEQNEQLEKKVLARTLDIQHSNDFILKQNEVLKKITWIQSHVVRAPVSRILGLSNLLELGEIEDIGYQEIISNIVSSCKELDNIIREISKLADEAEIDDPDE